MTLYLVFESPPRRSHWKGIPEPGNPRWHVGVYELVGETKQRLLLAHAGGETWSFSHDGQRRQYIEKYHYDRQVSWETNDLAAALAYREKVKAEWAAACAARDRVAEPLFAEIRHLQDRILEADAACDQEVPRIREACPRPEEMTAEEGAAA